MRRARRAFSGSWRGRPSAIFIGAAVLAWALTPGRAAAAEGIDFARQVQPIFVEHCYQCHGPDRQESGLRLDARESALRGGDSGPAWIAGKSGESELVRRLRAEDPQERMPPAEAQGKPLSAEEIGRIVAWIDGGAQWPQSPTASSTHWSFQPIGRPQLPAIKNERWVRNPIDRFILAGLESHGVEPSPEADRYTLIKRLSYDLLGLPPTVAEADAFAHDTSPDGYERLVDRLLDSPHFGERWGRHWLDMARYADSDGYEKDNPRPDAWRYRDWVIDAINADMPLDRFTIEQLAGDLLDGATPSQRLATAFHRQTLTNTEGGTDQEQFRVEAIFDRIATTGTVWLGLTIGCAQCHSHKYDPISHQDYYRLFAFFDNGDEVETEVPLSGEALVRWNAERDAASKNLAELAPKFAALRGERVAKLPAWEAELKSAPPSDLAFHPIELVSAQSSAGAEIKLLSDGSYLVAGKQPEVDRLTVTAKTDLKQITGFRLEALAHDSLGGRGPGRSEQGNFVLSEFHALAASTAEFKPDNRVELTRADSDFEQAGFATAVAIDGKDETGWGIAPQTGRDHWAVFMAKSPVGTGTAPWLQFTLASNFGQKHTLGRFRLLAVTGNDAQLGIPRPIRDILAVAPEKRSGEQSAALADYFVKRDDKAAKMADDIGKLQQRIAAQPVMKSRVIAERGAQRRVSHVLHRGDFLQPAEEVQPGTPGVLPPLVARHGGAADRLDFAQWLVDDRQPLVRRVMANHIWTHLFGQGLVRTPNDFGVRGERPTHPELLDWLASEMPLRGWSRKDMIRLIVSSAAYRQSSATREELAHVDPLNAWVHRQNRFRVEGEIVRDLALAAGGLLSEKIGGPSVYPPLPAGITDLSYAGNFKWNASTGEDRYRRGMYTFFKRTAPHPNLTTFDCPDANTTCVVRQTSDTPLQALTTLNNESFVEAAQAMARQALGRPAADDAERLTGALRACIVRPPSAKELAAFAELLAASRAFYAEHPADAAAIAPPPQPAGVSPAEQAAWAATLRIVLNLDEFLTRE